jgi:replicative DNA helicase
VISINDTPEGVTHDELLRAALGIARDGGRPLPCAYGSKKPVPVHGLKDAVTARDPEAFARYWWKNGALYNLAEATGTRFDVLDVDLGGLFIVPAMSSGSRKSPVYGTLTSPLRAAEKILADVAAKTMTEARTACAIADKAAAKAEKLAADAVAEAARITADPASTDQAKHEAEERKQKAEQDAVAKAQLAESVEVPVMPRLIVGDITPEKMTMMLAEQGGRLAVMSDEGGPLVNLAGRYSASREPDAEVWLTGHNGLHEVLHVDRVGRPPVSVQNPALTVCLAVQPGVLRALHRITQLRERGLLGRFLYAMPPNNVGYRRTRTAPVPNDVAAAYLMRMTGVVTALDGWKDPMELELDPVALEKLDLFREANELRLRPGADLGHMTEWGSKLPGRLQGR